MDIQFGMGFMVRSPLIPIAGPRSFGHFGAGGSMGWADPDSGLAFGYVMNRMDMGLEGDVRSANLVNVYRGRGLTGIARYPDRSGPARNRSTHDQ